MPPGPGTLWAQDSALSSFTKPRARASPALRSFQQPSQASQRTRRPHKQGHLPTATRLVRGRARQAQAAYGQAPYLKVLHGRGLLRALAEHRALQRVAAAGLQDVVEGAEICARRGARSWAAGDLPSSLVRPAARPAFPMEPVWLGDRPQTVFTFNSKGAGLQL